MRDIKCTRPNCGKIILYKDYCHELRSVNFKGIHCTHCGAEQLLEYQKIKGDGKIIKTKYESPGKTRAGKVQMYCSCPNCGIFWENGSELYCPCCHMIKKTDAGVEHWSVKGVSKIPEGYDKEQRKLQLKIDFLVLDNKRMLSDHFENKFAMEQQDIINKSCKLETKEVNKS